MGIFPEIFAIHYIILRGTPYDELETLTSVRGIMILFPHDHGRPMVLCVFFES